MSTFIKSVFNIFLGAFDFILQTAADFTLSAVPRKRNGLYNADFANPREVFNRNAGGFTISNNYSLTPKLSFDHLICTAATGAGKTSTVTIPSCLSVTDGSLVITDNAGDLFSLTAAFIKKGYRILILDLDRPNQSEGFNALSKCKGDADINKVANALIRNSIPADYDDFFSKSAEYFLSFFIRYLCQYRSPEVCTLSSVLELINVFSYDPERIDSLIADTNEQFINEYKAIAAIPDKTLASILATAKAALAIYGSDNIKQVCSFDSIDFDSLRKTPTVLMLRTNAADAHLYRGITATFFELLWSHILRTEITDDDLHLYCIIEEAGNYHLNTLSSAISLVRKKRVAIALFFQDYSQVYALYKDQAPNIISNCGTKIFLPGPKPLEMCQMLTDLMGSFQYDDDGTLRTRQLLSVQEIRELEEVLVLHSNKPPILLPLIPWYKSQTYKQLMEGPKYEVPNKLPFTTPPIINL